MKTIEYPLDAILRDGTSQEDRFNVALQDAYVNIEERELEDFLFFIHEFSKRINYYNGKNQLDGTWNEFFNLFSDKEKIKSAIDGLSQEQIVDPHLSLLLSFLHLFELAKNDLNEITEKHLEFYYQKVLQLQERSPEPDKVHVLFELTRNTERHLITAGTRLKAGKDVSGKEQYYEIKRDKVLNKATIAYLKSLYIDLEGENQTYAAPIANSLDGLGEPLPSVESGWLPFGQDQKLLSDAEKNMVTGTVGFGIASPQLLLKEGTRTVILEFDIDTTSPHPENQIFSNAFNLYFSSVEDWVTIENVDAQVKDDGTRKLLCIETQLTPDLPEVVPYNNQVLSGNFETQWPLVKLLLNPERNAYKQLKDTYITSLTITVDVLGVQDLIIQNDLGQLNNSKPFLPFGNSPVAGSNFYIGSDEIFQKELQDLVFNLHWADLPEGIGLRDYYSGYPNQPISDTAFEATLSILDKREWSPKMIDGRDFFPLFQIAGLGMNSEPYTQEVDDERIRLPRDPYLSPLSQFDKKTQRGFLKLTLNNPDFGHKDYPELYLNQTILKTAPGVNPSTIVLPNPPYTPLLQSISFDYTSSETITFDADNGIENFFHIEPFGHKKLKQQASFSFVPQFDNEGQLFIGLNDFVAPGTISFLFQVVEGSGDPNSSITSEDIQWSYLSNNEWIELPKLDVIVDTTQGFQTSGIVELSIGRDATSDNTLLAEGIHWIKASVEKNAVAACRIIEIYTQALEAEYVIDDSDEEALSQHFVNPLPPESISKLAVKDANVKSILQPYTPYSGRGYENGQDYYVRTSERLRHKNRAINLWDHERIVLESFPDTYKVKCLNHTCGKDSFSPGDVTLVVIQNLRQKNAVNPLEPRTDSLTLANIKSHVSKYVSPFVNVKVENPVYEQLLVHFKVGFHPEFDPGYYGNLLNEEIKKFLSPWAFEEGVDILFGGKVYKSDILFFIENRPYVDFVNEFKLYHLFEGEGRTGIDHMAVEIDFIVRPESPPGLDQMIIEDDFIIGEDVELAFATDPRAILVSAQNHYITVLKSGEYECRGVEFEGIGFMSVGLDFILA